jgi:hypothetical protein
MFMKWNDGKKREVSIKLNVLELRVNYPVVIPIKR